MAFGEIQRAVEKLFASSAYSRFLSAERAQTKNTHNFSKRTERKPVYVLNLSLSPSQVDNFMEPAKSMVRFQDVDRVLAFVLEAITRVLDKGKISIEKLQPADATSGSPRKRTRKDSPGLNTRSSHQISTPANTQKASAQVLPTFRPPIGHSFVPDVADDFIDDSVAHSSEQSAYFEWIDPSSGESFLVDWSTGNSFPSNQLPNYLCEGLDRDIRNPEGTTPGRRSLNPSCSDPTEGTN
ncbi:DNA mismatch repair protein [Ceratobasidium sp. AG-Ba]|nr:DNA mismatch repair protein [Ceratobasidium sp. AG-Ba]